MDEDWLLYFTTSFTFAVIFFLCYIRHVFTYFERNKIPRTVHPTFPFGNVYNVIYKRTSMFMQLWALYRRFKRKKYAFGGFYIFLKPAVLITDPQLTGRILRDNERTGIKYAFNADAKSYDYNFNAELSTRLLSNILERTQQILQRLVASVSEEEVNFTCLINNKFATMILKDLFNLPYEFYGLKSGSMFAMLKKLIAISYPQLSSLFYDNDVDRKIRMLNDREEEIKDNCIWQMLLKEGFSEEEIKNCIFYLADNLRKINSTLLFTLYEVSLDEEIQADLRAEIARSRKKDCTFNYQVLSELEYLETVVCETLRKYPVEPFIYTICKKDFTENDINFPKNILLFASIFGIHHDEQIYVNPQQFDPDRFCKENLKFIEQTKYLPFGIKDEQHFDVLYLKLIVKISLVELLARFKFSLGKKSSKTVQFNASVFNHLEFAEDLWLNIHV